MAGGFEVEFHFDGAAVQAKVDAARDRGIEKVAIEAAKDCDKYVPMKEGKLKESVFFGSDFKRGKLVWKMPYARRQYYGIHLKHPKGAGSKNKSARALWAHEGYAENYKKYKKIIASEAKREV